MIKKLSMHRKIILIQFISIVIIMLIFAIFLYNTNYNQEMNKIKMETEALTTKLTSNLAELVWNLEEAVSESIITQDLKNQYITCILVYQGEEFWIGKVKTEKGEILAVDDPAQYEKILKKSYLTQNAKINFGDKDIGQVIVYITDEHLKATLFNLFIQIFIQTIIMVIVLSVILYIVLNLFLARPLKKITEVAMRIADGEADLEAATTGQKEIATLAAAFNAMTAQLKNKAEMFKAINTTLSQIISKAKEIIIRLNSSAKEIEAAAQMQSSGATQYASGISEVSATLRELSITARQITNSIGELMYSGEEMTNLLKENNTRLLETVSQLDEVGGISLKNNKMIGELGNRSLVINEMAQLIKDIANKTNILSINASIEASRSREASSGFSVIAAEIRTLSKETIESAKKADIAAKEIQKLLNTIVISSESESAKIIESGKNAKAVFTSNENIMTKIDNNNVFTHKIDVSIKQQEQGSLQSSETIREMAGIAQQSAETTRETLMAVRSIVEISSELEHVIGNSQ